DAITAIVGTNGSEADVTTRKYFADDLGNLADTVILIRIADIQNLVVHSVGRCVQRAQNGLGNIEPVDEWPPGRSVAAHFDHVRSPGESTEIVHHQVESLSRRSAKRGRVPEKYGGEVVVGQQLNIPLNQRLANSIGRLGIYR